MTKNNSPLHPGAYLQKHYLDVLEVSAAEAAKSLGLNPSELTSFLQGESSVTPHLAARLELAVGGTAAEWMCRQVHHDAWASPVAVETPAHPPLESKLWGQYVGRCEVRLGRVVNGEPISCLALFGYGKDGAPEIVLTTPDLGRFSTMTCAIEELARELLAEMARTEVVLRSRRVKSEQGFACFRNRIRRAYLKAQAANERTAEGVSKAGGIRWFDFTLQGHYRRKPCASSTSRMAMCRTGRAM
jgi:addiction module HigA family antidote